MSRLKDRIVGLIEASGPLPVHHYMALCLADPRDGYYMTREPFGGDGDFTTAPEISQMFGELVAAWLYSAWHAAGQRSPVSLVEIGPGRGTLTKDMLRTLNQLDPAFLSAASVFMIETSPRLVEIQRRTLDGAPASIVWRDNLGDLPAQPLMIVGNELFDAIPLRQYVRTPQGWRERCVGLDETGSLAFVAGAGAVDAALLPPDAETASEGAVVELAPARSALMQPICEHIARHGGAGLFIDYGYAKPAVGDTLQALRKHAYDDPLAHPGEADITAHVDFSALAAVARAAGLDAQMMTQGAFLLGIGLLQRAGRLGAEAGPETREKLAAEVERLAGPEAMGNLFKAFAVLPRGTVAAPFAGSD